jgi:hypothetical protein
MFLSILGNATARGMGINVRNATVGPTRVTVPAGGANLYKSSYPMTKKG